jgi:exonuclease VII large subunit
MVNLRNEDVRDRLGNIDQIRDLLFGNIIADYDQRFTTSIGRIEKLETELVNFQTETRDRLDHLQESLTNELRNGLSAMEKQLQYLNYTAHEQTNHLQFRVHEIEQKGDTGLETLHKNLASQTTSLKTELLEAREQLEAALRALEKRVFDEIDKDLSSMKSGKISRVDLADLLFELCLKVKGAEFTSQLNASVDSSVSSDFLLPEQIVTTSSQS